MNITNKYKRKLMLKMLHNQLYSHNFKLYNMVCHICYMKHNVFVYDKILKCYTLYSI